VCQANLPTAKKQELGIPKKMMLNMNSRPCAQ
jgi:hypothetical protein